MPYYNRPSALNYMLELEEEERWSHHLQLKNDAMAVEVGPGAISAGPRKYYVGWRHTLSTIPSSLSSKMLQKSLRSTNERKGRSRQKKWRNRMSVLTSISERITRSHDRYWNRPCLRKGAVDLSLRWLQNWHTTSIIIFV